MVCVVSSIPSRDNFIFADIETPRCQFCTKMPDMAELCYLGKTRFIMSISGVCSAVQKLKSEVSVLTLTISCGMFSLRDKCVPRLIT